MKRKTVVGAISFALSSFANSPEQLQIQSVEPISNFVQVAFTQPEAPPDSPDRRPRGTGSRGGCSIVLSPETKINLTLTPLIPENDDRGYTSVESPIIWVNVSYSSDIPDNQKISGRFLVQHPKTHEDQTEPIPVTLPRTSGTFSIPFPYPLKVGEWSRWYLLIDDCPAFVQGLVQRRVDRLEIKNQIEAKTPQERFRFYTDNGLWYDALNEAIEIRCNNQQKVSPNDPWEVLLSDDDINLQEIAKTPLICQQ